MPIEIERRVCKNCGQITDYEKGHVVYGPSNYPFDAWCSLKVPLGAIPTLKMTCASNQKLMLEFCCYQCLFSFLDEDIHF